MTNYLDVILTILSILIALLTIATFYSNKQKASKTEGQQEGTLNSDLQYIKSLLVDVRTEIADLKKQGTESSDRLTREVNI